MDSSDAPTHPLVFANIRLFLPQQNESNEELPAASASTHQFSSLSASTSTTSFSALVGHGGAACKRQYKCRNNNNNNNNKNRRNFKNKRPMHYLKPGALAQLRDAQRSARLYPSTSPDGNSLGFCYNVYKKRKSRRLHKDADAEEGEEHDEDDTPARFQDVRRLVAIQSNNHGVVADQAPNAPSAVSHDMTPGPVVRVFGPLCPQRKKLLAPKASFATQPSASPSFSSPLPPSEEFNYAGESLLESIPLELLVRIVCNLRHDQLKPAFHVSRRLRQAVLIARQCHFDYTTPDRERQDAMDVSTPRTNRIHGGVNGSSIRIPSPKAPKPAQKLLQARISLAEMKQLAIPLFHGSVDRVRRMKPPTLMSQNAFRAATSHRVLFYEEELCQAVAQNSI